MCASIHRILLISSPWQVFPPVYFWHQAAVSPSNKEVSLAIYRDGRDMLVVKAGLYQQQTFCDNKISAVLLLEGEREEKAPSNR